MAAFQYFYPFVEYLAEKVVDLDSDQFVYALCAAANPPLNANGVLADLTQASYTFCSSRNVVTASGSQTSGTYKLITNELILTATGGVVGPFRYVVMYDDTAAGDVLVGFWDYSADYTIPDGQTFTITPSAIAGVLQILSGP